MATKKMNIEEIELKIETKDSKRLQARKVASKQGRFAVVCHPHPLYGGNMDNNVVLAARDSFLGLGLGTLRFNFRGVGASTGSFEEGDGESVDVIAACDYLKNQSAASIHVAAYSFGSFAFLKAIGRGLEVDSATLISPPASFMDFSNLDLPDRPCLIVLGDADQYCAVEDLERWLESRKSPSKSLTKTVLPGTDHFYWGSEEALKEALVDFWSENSH